MSDTPNNSPEEFAQTREHEYQDPHYHDEEPDIVNDELATHMTRVPTNKKKASRRPTAPGSPLRRLTLFSRNAEGMRGRRGTRSVAWREVRACLRHCG